MRDPVMSGDIVAHGSQFSPIRMGLEPRDLDGWLKPRDGDQAILAERVDLMSRHPNDVIAIRPEGESAVAELATVLEARGFSGLSHADGHTILKSIGRTIAEDLCILTASDQGYRLSAAMLCFPNRWRLADKIGHGLVAVHGPVPDYPEVLAETVERFLVRLRPMRPFVRENWGFASQPGKYLPQSIPPVNPAGSAPFFLRTEEQGFLKLPATQAVIFSIRTVIVPWSQVPESRRRGLMAAVAALSPAWRIYKSIA